MSAGAAFADHACERPEGGGRGREKFLYLPQAANAGFVVGGADGPAAPAGGIAGRSREIERI